MNDDALAYAKELLEEFGGSYRAKIKAISRLREQFSLGLREAKQIVDTAYEERCAEEEMKDHSSWEITRQGPRRGKTIYHRRQRRCILSITKAPTGEETVSLSTHVVF